MVLKGQIYRKSYNNEKYLTLGGCIGLKMEIYRKNYNNEKYFTLGGCAEFERPIYRRSYNNKKYIHKKDIFINKFWNSEPSLIN